MEKFRFAVFLLLIAALPLTVARRLTGDFNLQDKSSQIAKIKVTQGSLEDPKPKGSINYYYAAGGINTLASGIGNLTGKITMHPGSKEVVDGIANVAQGVGGIMMAISPGTGPAAPFVMAIGAGISIMAGISKDFTASSSPSLSALIQEGFNHLGLKLDGRFERLENLLEVDLSFIREGITALKLESENVFVYSVDSFHSKMVRLAMNPAVHKKTIASILEEEYPSLKEKLTRFRSSWEENMRFVLSESGKAAVAARFHQTFSARIQATTLLYMHAMLQADVHGKDTFHMLALRIEDLTNDIKRYKDMLDDLDLWPWLRVPAEELQPYLSVRGTEDWNEVQRLKSDLASKKSSKLDRLNWLQDLDSIVKTATVDAVTVLREMLVIDPDICAAAASVLGSIGSPGAEEAIPNLEHIAFKQRWNGRVERCVDEANRALLLMRKPKLQLKGKWTELQCVELGGIPRTSFDIDVTKASTISTDELGIEITASMGTKWGNEWESSQTPPRSQSFACPAEREGPDGWQCMFQWVVEESDHGLVWRTRFVDCKAGRDPPSCPPGGC